MHWACQYIGMRHRQGGRGPKEVDCWGLLRLVYAQKFSISLPELPGVCLGTLASMASHIASGLQDDWVLTEVPFDGCAVAMSQREVIHHVGLWATADGGKIIHCWDSHNVIADTLLGIRQKGFRVVRFYRHRLWPL